MPKSSISSVLKIIREIKYCLKSSTLYWKKYVKSNEYCKKLPLLLSKKDFVKSNIIFYIFCLVLKILLEIHRKYNFTQFLKKAKTSNQKSNWQNCKISCNQTTNFWYKISFLEDNLSNTREYCTCRWSHFSSMYWFNTREYYHNTCKYRAGEYTLSLLWPKIGPY